MACFYIGKISKFYNHKELLEFVHAAKFLGTRLNKLISIHQQQVIQKRNWENQSYYNSIQKNNYFGINVIKEVKYLYAKNYKTLLKRI
jgi:hypothetical protein